MSSPVAVSRALLLAVALALTFTVSRSSSGSSLDVSKLGMYVGFDEGGRFDRFERELGTPIRWAVTMADSRSVAAMKSSVWGQFAAPGAYLPEVAGRVNVVLSMPLAFGPGGMGRTAEGQATIGANLRATAAGRLDGDFREAARYLIDAGYPDAVIRLGHEFDGDWAPYSARNNNEAYIAAFRHVRDVFAAESSGFRFEWTSMSSDFVQHGPPAYPGDKYVDIVGLDIYYRAPGAISDAVWEREYAAVLRAHRDFAVARGKPVSYPEWGRALEDEARFIDLMYGWFLGLPASGPGSLLYHAYFNEWHMPTYNLDDVPTVKRRYIDLFGGGSSRSPAPSPAKALPAATPPATPPPPATAPQPAPAAGVPSIDGPASVPSPAYELAEVGNVVTGFGAVSVPGSGTEAALTLSFDGVEIDAEWSHPTAKLYLVRYRAVGTQWWRWSEQMPSKVTSMTLPGLDPSQAYVVQVIAYVDPAWRSWNSAVVTSGVSPSQAVRGAAND